MALKGQLQDLSVADLVKIHCFGQTRACVKLIHTNGNAELYFDGGNLIDAHFDSFGGDDAVYKALSLVDGRYQIELNAMASQRTVRTPWRDLLKQWGG